MQQLFRLSPGLFIVVLLLLGGVLVSSLVGFLMHRAGVSLRPIAWFAGFFLLIVLPQFVLHLRHSLELKRADDRVQQALSTFATSVDRTARAAAAREVFGPDADPDLILDARTQMAASLPGSTQAAWASFPDGSNGLLAHFPDYKAAQAGWSAYLQGQGLALTGRGDSERGYATTRATGERVYALPTGRTLVVWIAANDPMIRKRATAAGWTVPWRAPLEGGSGGSGVGRFFAIAAGMAALAVFAAFVFFRGTSWAGSSRAREGVSPVAASELEARLLAINELGQPFSIEPGSAPGEFLATWRWADARWMDFARLHKMTRVHRIRLRLNPETRTVTSTDFVAEFDGSAGLDGARLRWRHERGVVLFQHSEGRVFGVQFDTNGLPKAEAGYMYRFNLNEMKSPLIEAVTRAGWNWKPVAWEGPAWLRWLTG